MNMAMDDRIRASDADRERIAARLREHYAEGRLNQEELDERIAAALSARTYGDLRRVMADLPEPGMAPQPWGWPVRAAPRPVLVRTGPPVLPLAFLFVFLALLLPGGGWLFFGFFQLFVMVALIAAGVSIVAASSARRRARRHWQDRGYPGPWGPPTGHLQ
jgi:hypothetical protein